MKLKDIDKIYEKGFESFKEPPPAALWDRLDGSLNVIETAYKKPIATWLRNSLFVLIGAIIMSAIIYFSTAKKSFNVQPQNKISQNSIQNPSSNNSISKSITEKEENNSITKQEINTNEEITSKNHKPNNYQKETIQKDLIKTQANYKNKNTTKPLAVKTKTESTPKTAMQQASNFGNINTNANKQSNNEYFFANLPYPVRVNANFPLLENYKTRLQLNERNEYKLPVPNGKIKTTHITSLAVDVTVGGSQIINNFNNPPNYESHTDYRRKNETKIFTPSYNLNLRYTIDNLSITTGLNYSIFGEKINYLFENLKYDTIPFQIKVPDVYWVYDTVDFYQDPNNPNIWFPVVLSQAHDTFYSFWTDKDTIIKTTNEQKSRNTYTYFEIPVLIGYNFHHKKWSFELSTGVSFGILSNSKGYILNTNNESVTKNNKDNLPLNKTSLNYLLVGGVSYNMTKRISIILQPYYKRQLTSVFGNNYPIEQRYSAFGVNGGIRYLIK